ncbi:MAG: tetratricopeptide repeat protein, partial [Candidatus Sumerlaeaceae bacterium]|nr:tetratricopeptide repeat protein [Candidatus Sumerlaeaceae bacterium]
LLLSILAPACALIARTRSAPRFLVSLGAIIGLMGMLLSSLACWGFRWPVGLATTAVLAGLAIAVAREEQGATVPAPSQPTGGVPTVNVRYLQACVAAVLLFYAPFGIAKFRAAMENAKGLQTMDQAERAKGQERDRLNRAAAESFERAVAIAPSFLTSHYKLGHVYNQLGDTTNTIAAYERLRAIDPNYADLPLNLAVAYANQARTLTGTEKIAWLEKAQVPALEAAAHSWKPDGLLSVANTLKELAQAYDEAGQTEKAVAARASAIEIYDKVLSYKPKTAEYREDSEKAAPIAREALGKLR